MFSRKPRIFYTLSGVKSRTYPLSPDPDRFFEEARAAGVSYVVLDRVDRLAAAYYVGPVLRARPEAFCGLIGVGRREAPTQILGIVDRAATRTADAVDDTTGSEGIVPCPEGMLRSEPRTLPPYTTSRLPLLALPSP